ncbi:mCG144657, partial [Mus musculus]
SSLPPKRTPVWFLKPTSGSSQPPVSPTPWDPTASSGLCQYPTHVAYTQRPECKLKGSGSEFSTGMLPVCGREVRHDHKIQPPKFCASSAK